MERKIIKNRIEDVVKDFFYALETDEHVKHIHEIKREDFEVYGNKFLFFINYEIGRLPSFDNVSDDYYNPAYSIQHGEIEFDINGITGQNLEEDDGIEYDVLSMLTKEEYEDAKSYFDFNYYDLPCNESKSAKNSIILINESDILYMVKRAVNEIASKRATSVILLKEQYESRERPAVYVGTYGKYNSGSLQGEWVNLDDFDSKEEFLAYCIQTLHANERGPELMFQYWEYIPDGFIGESYISDQLWDFINLQEDYSIKYAIAQHCGDVKKAMNILDNQDYSVHYGCDDVEDVVYQYLDEFGPEGFSNLGNLDMYFDYESFGRECSWNRLFDDRGEYESVYQEFGVDEDDDEALGEEIIDQLYGGIENAPKETVQKYISIKMLAQALERKITFIEVDTNNGSAVIELYKQST